MITLEIKSDLKTFFFFLPSQEYSMPREFSNSLYIKRFTTSFTVGSSILLSSATCNEEQCFVDTHYRFPRNY